MNVEHGSTLQDIRATNELERVACLGGGRVSKARTVYLRIPTLHLKRVSV